MTWAGHTAILKGMHFESCVRMPAGGVSKAGMYESLLGASIHLQALWADDSTSPNHLSSDPSVVVD